MATKTLSVAKDINVRYEDPGGDEQNGKDRHLRIGKKGTHTYEAFLNINQNWDGVGKIVSAVLRLTMSDAHTNWGSSPRILIQQVKENWAEGSQGENVWGSWSKSNYGAVTSGQHDQSFAFALNATIDIPITNFMGRWAPTSVRRSDGSPGGAQPDYGIRIRPYSISSLTDASEFYSSDETNSARRPVVILTYEPAPTAPSQPNSLTPYGITAKVNNFSGAFQDINTSDKLKETNIILYASDGVTKLWETSLAATPSEQAANAFSVAIPPLVLLETTYAWKARTRDSTGRWGPFSGLTYFTFTNTPPALTLVALGSYPSLAGVLFRGNYSDTNGHGLGAFRIQLRPTTTPGDPTWDGNTNLWDTSDTPPTAEEVAGGYFSRPYGGQPLTPGTYSWRAKVFDKFGAQSSWEYSTVTLTEAWSPDPGDIDNVTGYQKKASTRIVLRSMGTGRGPANPPIAIIEDAANIGASKYLNAPGEFYMTLPALHPQVQVCEPYQTHYAVEVWHGDRWTEVYAGILTDFDAGEDDVVIYGMDYLGLLDLCVDERYDKTAPDKDYSAGGSKYTDDTISTVILNQIAHQKTKSNTPIGFIANGQMDTFAEKVTIFSTFKQVGPFIMGLIRSHRQGTGKRSRLQVRKNVAGTGYEFVMQDNPGVDRNNMRLEYGGLIQGFRLVVMGEFATFFYGLGRTREGITPMFQSAAAPGIPPATWGRIERAQYYQDLIDDNDLKRRVQQDAAEVGRVGKRVALGLRTDAILPFDGYDITDNVPVHIKRGVVDTTRYGSGYWSILGVEWRVYPDGHSETTLVVLPKEDGVPPNPDLIPSDPSAGLGGSEWEIGYEPPVQGVNTGKLYLDLTTGITYIQNPDGTFSVLDSPTQVTPPDGLSLTTSMALNEAGLPVVKLTATVTPDASWGTEYRGSWVEVTSQTDIDGNPVWGEPGTSTLLYIPAGETSASIEGVQGGVEYFARAWAVDFVGVPSTITASTSTVMAADNAAPGQPQSFTLVAGVRGFAAGWGQSSAKDLSYFELRYAIDDGSGTGPGTTPDWTSLRAKTTFIWVGGLVEGQKYWAQVRAVDVAGNVEDLGPPVTVVKAETNEDSGYTDVAEVTPTAVGGDLIEPGSIDDSHIITTGLSAEVIKTGTLYVDSTDDQMLDGLQVLHNGVPVGFWNETGLYIYEEDDPSNYIRLFDAGLTVFRGGVPTTAITPEGINASAILFGQLPGGNNIILNSSFEMTEFSVSADVDVVWTASADWNATRVGTATNVTTNAGDLQQTGATY